MVPEIDLSSAINFVGQNGTILEKARLLRILMEIEPSPEAYLPLVKIQNPDGGFPSRPKPGSQSALDSTLTALWQFEEMGMLATPEADRAIEFLLAMQREDGGWDENPDLPTHDLPPWIIPGDLSSRLYLTTYAAFWLAARGQISEPGFQRSLAFIAAHQEESGMIPGYRHNNWLGISAFLMAETGSAGTGGSRTAPTFAENAQRGLDYLAALPFSEWEDSQIGWALDCLTRAGLPPAHSFVLSALAELIRRQAADGSWASEDGPAFAASATVTALKVIKRLTSLPPLA